MAANFAPSSNRFSLRSLFACVFVVALCLGGARCLYLAHIRATATTAMSLKDELSANGSLPPITYTWDYVTDSELRELADSGRTRYAVALSIEGCKVTDLGVSYLKEMRYLRRLKLNTPLVTSAGLKHLEEARTLRYLVITGNVDKNAINSLKKALPQCEVITY